MVTSLCLITCALTTAQPAERGEWLLSPSLQPGVELVYSGSCTDEDLVPHVVFQRQYKLEVHVLVLGAKAKDTDVAILTALSLRDTRAEKEPKGKKKEPGWSVRLELARLDLQGNLLGEKAKLSWAVNGPPTVETGAFVQFPLVRVGKSQSWEVSEEGRPARTWSVLGTEPEGGVTCLKLLGQQQSEDWDRPRADKTAWRRRDTVWLNPALGIAHKVERVIERRDPARREPTHRTTVQYTLDSKLKYPGNLFDDRRHEVLKAQKFHDEAAPLLKAPAMFTAQIEALQRKISLSMDASAPTPYRKAIQHLQARLEGARKGESPPGLPGEEPAVLPKAIAIGKHVPDVVASELGGKNTTRLHRLLGKPVLVFFYNPAAETSKEVLRFVHHLSQKHPGAVNVLAMAVTDDAELACKQQSEMGLPFAIHDGKAFHATFGVDATPRLVVIDGEGVVRATHTGWGLLSPQEIADEVRRCLPRSP